MHQAVHEYFAALKLKNLISSVKNSERKSALNIAHYSPLTGINRQLRKWAKDDWWAEVILQLSGITEHPMHLAKQVLHSNPWLAYWCSIEGLSLSIQMQSQIEKKTVAKLSSTRIEERLQVVKELARMENPRTISYLIIALDDSSTHVQELSSQTIVRLGEPSVEPLLESLTSAKENARLAAIRILGMIWKFPQITELGSEDTSIQYRATEVLGNLGDNRAVLPLIATLKESNRELRKKAAQSLGKLGDPRAVTSLIKTLEQTYSQAQSDESSEIAKALAKLGKTTHEPLLVALKDPEVAVRQRALISLGKIWEMPLIAKLADHEPSIRGESAQKLGELADERILEPLLSIVHDQDQLVRWRAIGSLGRFWQCESLMNLGNPDTQIRQAAAKDLHDSPELRFIDPLIATLRDRDPVVRDYAAGALGRLGEVAVDSLVPLLHYQDREIGQSVAKAFAKVYDYDSLERIRYILLSAIQDHRWWVRETAAEALVKLGNRGLLVLKIVIRSPDPDVRELARFVLRRIGTIQALDILHDPRNNTQRKDSYIGKWWSPP